MDWLESQIEARSRLDAEITERAYAELAASVTDAGRGPRISASTLEQMDGAVKACLHYIGAEPGAVDEGISDFDERLELICRPSGTMFRDVNLTGNWYKQAFGAMLGRLDTGEAIALLPRGVRGYYYLEPGTGRKVRVTSQTAAHIETDAVFFYHPLPQRALTLSDLAVFLTRIFDRNDYLLVLAAAVAATLVGLIPPWANKVAFGVVVPSGQANLIAPIGAMLLGVAVSTVLIGICRNLVMARVGTKLDVVTQSAMFARVLSLPPSFFKEYESGNLAMRLSQITMFTQQMVSMLLGSGLTMVLAVVYIAQIGAFAPVLMVPALVVVLVQAALTIIALRIQVRYEERAMEASAAVSGTETALLNGVTKLKLAGAEDRAFAKWAHGYSEYADAKYNHPALVRALPAFVTLVGLLGTIVIYWFAGSNNVAIDSYMAFNASYGQVTGAIMMFATMAGQMALIRPMVEMVTPILEATPETADDKPVVGPLSGAIEVSNVFFRYGPDQPYIVEDLSFKIRPGEYVALVGKSGCGKSTIMRLLLGFETPERGSIFYGPYDVSRVDQRSLRQSIGTVMQDGKLFMGDLASNITISTPSATLDDAWEAAELAGIADDIRKMPMGMHTFVTEGSGGVSGGQRQRLMIARAVCGKRKILMLDEATSALDNKTQKHVADSLDSLNCTRVVVAHRLSTVRHCDRILVIDNGRIAEEGTYDELIARDGLFTELVKRQRLDV